MTVISTTTATGPDLPPAEARLRAAARQLEAAFVQQLFAAMRATVPEEGAVQKSSGEDMFTGMLDQRLADELPARWDHGISDALVAQLRRRLPAEPESGAGAPTR